MKAEKASHLQFFFHFLIHFLIFGSIFAFSLVFLVKKTRKKAIQWIAFWLFQFKIIYLTTCIFSVQVFLPLCIFTIYIPLERLLTSISTEPVAAETFLTNCPVTL